MLKRVADDIGEEEDIQDTARGRSGSLPEVEEKSQGKSGNRGRQKGELAYVESIRVGIPHPLIGGAVLRQQHHRTRQPDDGKTRQHRI